MTMKPLRRKHTRHVTQDPVTGQDRTLGWTCEEDVLSDHGSVDSTSMQRKFFLDCGCDGEAAGRCFECGSLNCSECYGRCQQCRKPICMQHSCFLETDQGEMRLCGRCFDKTSRKRTRAKVGRFLLSLFVEKGASND